ncbi:L-threonylcarbamoyladenylate synthase [Peptococcaceae bacterium 1198_IL3148]
MNQHTKYWQINNIEHDNPAIKEAGQVLRQGGLVAFPTETVYGLGANALNGPAVEGIFKAKGRPADNPLIVHIATTTAVAQVANVNNPQAEKLMQAFWPGPLTLVLPKTNVLPDEVTAGLDTVGVRMPNHPVALALIEAAGVPIAAPSANLSGSPSPTTAQHVLDDLTGRIAGVLDGGPANLGVESTVLDVTTQVPTILRPGGVTAEQIKAVCGAVCYDPALDQQPNQNITPRSPGVKYKHYSPQAPTVLLEGRQDLILQRLLELFKQYRAQGKQVGILTGAENADKFPGATVLSYGKGRDPAAAAAALYASLRQFDQLGVDVILAEGIPDTGLGRAVMDRLRRAAGGNIQHL